MSYEFNLNLRSVNVIEPDGKFQFGGQSAPHNVVQRHKCYTRLNYLWFWEHLV